MAEGQALSQRTDALDVIVELLGALDGEKGVASGREFYDRLCEACCRVASMERAGLLLYDDARQLVVPVGSHGLEPDLFAEVYGTLEETPIAQVALSEDRVVEVTGELERWVPERYAHLGGVETLTCVPVSAGGRWLGVIFADRGGTRFELTDAERHAMWTLGKTAALAASVRIATSQQGRARLLQARIDLARELHERVVQRLFGVSLVLGSEHALSEEARQRCASEMHAALADLRDALSRPLAPSDVSTPARPCATSSPGSAATTRTCRSSSTGRRGWRCRRMSSRWRSRCWPRRSATRTSTRGPARCACTSGASTAPSCSRCATTAPSPPTRAAAPAWACAWRRSRRSSAARSSSSGRRAGDWRVRLVVPLEEIRGMSPDRNLRVLVVDDHDVVHWGFRLLLTEQPWVERCLTASSVEEALEMARRYEPHVALVDLFLGEESGAELCEAIRARVAAARACC